MLNILLPLAGLAAAAAAVMPSPPPSLFNDSPPPVRFQHNAVATLDFREQADINETCQTSFGKPPAGMRTNGCTIGARIVLPNPCDRPDDAYARLLCHELAHVNGWPATHGG